MKRVVAERDRDIDFSRGKRGPVIKPEPGKTKISIWFDNAVLERFRDVVRKAGGGSYQTAINEALRRAMESSEGHVEKPFVASFGRRCKGTAFGRRAVGPAVEPVCRDEAGSAES